MNKRYLPFILAVILPLLASCAEENLGVWGLMLEIRDARTGAPAAYDAKIIVRDGAYTDTVRGSGGALSESRGQIEYAYAAWQRPGTYDVTIIHPEC